MKGISIEYVAFTILFLTVVAIGIGVINYFSKKTPIPPDKIIYNVTSQCIVLNDTAISFSDFGDVFYGFMTNQCNDFQAKLTEKITFDDIVRLKNSWDESIPIVKIRECKLPDSNSHTIYVNFETDEIRPNSKIYLKRREIKSSDVLICEIL